MTDAPEKKRLRELALRAAHTGEAAFTRFLEPPLEGEARAAAVFAGVRATFWGGFADAERRVAAFAPAEVEEGAFPVRPLVARWNPRYGSPAHRDLLGALMGLGVVREALGDIAVFEDHALLFAHADVADYLLASLESAGRARLKLSPAAGDFAPPAPEGVPLYRTVPSARLDAVLAAAWDLSRQEASKRVEAGLVKVNHVVAVRPDARLDAGDLVSARGLGRFRLAQITGETRKGRLGIRLLVYGK